jgi:hypothetical protein
MLWSNGWGTVLSIGEKSDIQWPSMEGNEEHDGEGI